jgi:hypothetical protein
MNKVYTLRALQSDDLFLMLKVINKIGIKEIKKCFESEAVIKAISSVAGDKKGEDVDNDVATVGMTVMLEIADVFARNLPACRDELYQLLSTLSGMTVEEIARLPMLTMVDMVMDVIKMQEFADFFQRLFGSRETAT